MKQFSFILVFALLLGFCAGCAQANRAGETTTTPPEYWTEGICLVVDSGTVLIVADGEPIVMGDGSKEGKLFDGLQTGDHIRVVCGEIMESYPAQTTAYKLEKTGSGSINDIPEQTLEQLRTLGWID